MQTFYSLPKKSAHALTRHFALASICSEHSWILWLDSCFLLAFFSALTDSFRWLPRDSCKILKKVYFKEMPFIAKLTLHFFYAP